MCDTTKSNCSSRGLVSGIKRNLTADTKFNRYKINTLAYSLPLVGFVFQTLGKITTRLTKHIDVEDKRIHLHVFRLYSVIFFDCKNLSILAVERTVASE